MDAAEGTKVSGIYMSWGGLALAVATVLGAGALGAAVGFTAGVTVGERQATDVFRARLAALEGRMDARGDARNTRTSKAHEVTA